MRVRKDERNRKVVEMRKGGAQYKDIAERFGISPCRARQIVQEQARRDERDAEKAEGKKEG